MSDHPTPADALDEVVTRVLYLRLLDAWNARDAHGFAQIFADDANLVGFDGSQVDGRAAIESHLAGIFVHHETPAYVGIIRDVRRLTEDVELLRAVAGMIPAGHAAIDPALNAVQSLVAVRRNNEWRVALFHNTPAAFHERRDLRDALTAELQKESTPHATE